MEHIELEASFSEIGGQFVLSAFDLAEQLKQVKAFVFDWDGVFNDAFRSTKDGSGFSEIDVNGIQQLLFAHWLSNGNVAHTAIFSDYDNNMAQHLAKREGFTAYYVGGKSKRKNLLHFCDTNGISPSEVLYVYDDLNDISLAKEVGLRIAIGRLPNPVFLNHVAHNRLADYITACQGSEHAIRECTELLICLMNKEEEVFMTHGQSEAFEHFSETLAKTKTNTYELDKAEQIGIGFKPNT